MDKKFTVEVKPQGLAPRFPRIKAYLDPKKWDEVDISIAVSGLEEFAYRTGNHLPGSPGDIAMRSAAAAGHNLLCIAINHIETSVRKGVSGEVWLPLFSKAVMYFYWCRRFQLSELVQAIDKGWPCGRDSILTTGAEDCGDIAGYCLALGWYETAVSMVKRFVWALNMDLVDDLGRACCAQYFVIRLLAQKQGWAINALPKYATAEPLFELLLNCWDTTDVAALGQVLIAVLDRHTHETKRDMDFHDQVNMYFPFEVLSVLRMREMAGLENPALTHYLTETPLGRLLPVQPLHQEELMDAVVVRAREVLPDLTVD
jgi:hypothetical protein